MFTNLHINPCLAAIVVKLTKWPDYKDGEGFSGLFNFILLSFIKEALHIYTNIYKVWPENTKTNNTLVISTPETLNLPLQIIKPQA